MMKKFLALLLAMMMLLSLAACGSDTDDSDEEDSTPAQEEEQPSESATAADNADAEISDEQLQALTEAYNAVAPIYNDAYTAADENGWMDDEQTAAEIQALSGTLSYVGTALTEDLTMLDGSDFDALTASLQELVAPTQELLDRVSVP